MDGTAYLGERHFPMDRVRDFGDTTPLGGTTAGNSTDSIILRTFKNKDGAGTVNR
jgi:hypothetical protein